MLSHGCEIPTIPTRAVVLGATGFIGAAICRHLGSAGASILKLGRNKVDLLADGAAQTLAQHLNAEDTLIAVSALAPVKDPIMLRDNMTIIATMAEALRAQPVAHVLNIGSDAVFADSPDRLTETSSREAGSLHGVMHLARELALSEAAGETPFSTLRPTLVYGVDDPHNGYGPNRYRRQAAVGEAIKLFGEGEERRDHVWVEDVADLATRIVLHRSSGSLNAATGEVVSFRDLAEAVAGFYGNAVVVEGSPRSGPMPHSGYRPFDVSATTKAFPDFAYTKAMDGIKKVHAQLGGGA